MTEIKIEKNVPIPGHTGKIDWSFMGLMDIGDSVEIPLIESNRGDVYAAATRYGGGKVKSTQLEMTNDKYNPVPNDTAYLTKREYFAAMALSGMMANYDQLRDGDNTVAVDAVRLADRLIEALNASTARS